MSTDMPPTRRTRIHPKGLQSPLEGQPLQRHRGEERLHLQVRYARLSSYMFCSRWVCMLWEDKSLMWGSALERLVGQQCKRLG
jgi:hypothetical protein